MPLLREEPAFYPAHLFDQVVQSTTQCSSWCVMHTRPRQEKSLARALHKAEISFYLPLIVRHLRFRGRSMKSFRPLFDGYVFVLADNDERVAALSTGHVAQILDVVEQDRLTHDLRRIAQLIASGAAITPEDRFGPGTRVIVRSGPFEGLTGTIIREASKRRFIVQVDFLQKGASALLDDDVLVTQV